MLHAWTEVVLGAGDEAVMHPHLIAVDEGEAIESSERGTARLQAGRLFIRDGGIARVTALRTPFRAMALSVDGPLLPALHDLFGAAARCDVCATALSGVIDRLRFELRQSGREAKTIVTALLFELIGLAARLSRGRAPELERLDPLLAAPDRLRKLSPSEVAGEIGLSPAMFAGACRRVFGVSAAVFLRDFRLWQAARALARGNVPIAEIALECGFYDQSHLTNAFRSRYGMTPLQFRRCASNRRSAPSACDTNV